MDPDIRKDARWQLIERIAASDSFQKSTRLRELLHFIADRTLHDDTLSLGEHQIGMAVFGKPEDYSAVEDSSVRVQVRQLRLKLHEYFNGEGREETCIVEIPKGSYTAVFRSIEQQIVAPATQTIPRPAAKLRLQMAPWTLATFFLITTLFAWFHHPVPAPVRSVWPLDSLFDQGNHPVLVVVADVNYGVLELFSGDLSGQNTDQRVTMTLERYLSPAYRSGAEFSNAHTTDREARILKYLSGSVLTSFADLTVVNSLIQLSGDSRERLSIRSSRSLRPSEIEEGSSILVGGPTSNPWVLYFQDRLNFQMVQTVPGKGFNCFENEHPTAMEQKTYCGLPLVGSSGEDYATISLLPLSNGHGSVLILQGLHQESTESAGLFLADVKSRQQLEQALGISDAPKQAVYFEALIRTKSIEGAPMATASIVATRVLHP